MKSDNEVLQDWTRIETENIERACELLRGYDNEVENYLAHIVASLCGVDVEKMLSDTSVAYLAQPRWLYWYAVRYMTNETYEKIAARTETKSGYHFTPNGIGQSINKMSAMIINEPIWTKRWTILKHIIKLRDNVKLSDGSYGDVLTMRVIAPKGVKLNIKTE